MSKCDLCGKDLPKQEAYYIRDSGQNMYAICGECLSVLSWQIDSLCEEPQYVDRATQQLERNNTENLVSDFIDQLYERLNEAWGKKEDN